MSHPTNGACPTQEEIRAAMAASTQDEVPPWADEVIRRANGGTERRMRWCVETLQGIRERQFTRLGTDGPVLVTVIQALIALADGVQEVGFAQPVAWRVRGYNQFKTGAPRPWRYFDGSERPKVNDPDGCDIEPVYGCPSVRACGLPSNYVNAARILASDMPATVVQKLDAAARAAGVPGTFNDQGEKR